MRFPQDVPVLSDGVVTLRAHQESDIDPMYEMTRDADALRWTAIPLDNTREGSRLFATEIMRIGWEQRNFRGWAIEAEADDGMPAYAGNIDVRGTPIADVGYVLHPWARGRGIVKRALELAANWSFTEGGVEIIHWRSHVGNEASLRAAHAAGFTLNGTAPGLLYEREQVLDAWTGHLRFGDLPGPKTTWHETTAIDGDSLRLRPYRTQDIPRIVEACNDERSKQWLAGLPRPYTEKTARDYLHETIWDAATGNRTTWAVADKGTDLMIGNIAIFGTAGLDPRSGEIGYWSHPDSRGRGLMTQATRLIIAHAFGDRGMRRLQLHAASANTASNQVALNNGFVLTGTETRADPVGDGTFADMNIYELFPS